MLKRILPRKAATDPEVAPPISDWHLDLFEMHGDILGILGWSFDSAHPRAARVIVAYDTDGTRLAAFDALNAQRPDLILHMGTVDVLDAGFRQNLRIVSPRDIAVFLEYEAEDEVKQFPLGIVPANAPDSRFFLIEAATDDEVRANDAALGLSETQEGAEVSEQSFSKKTPWQPFVGDAALVAYLSQTSSPAVVVFAHALGGGAEQYLAWRSNALTSEGKRFIVIRFDDEAGCFLCEARLDDGLHVGSSNEVESIFQTVMGVEQVWVNNLAGYPNIASLLPLIAAYAQTHDADLTFFVHDYAALCANYNLVRPGGSFCGLPAHDECNACFSTVHSREFAHAGISEYRRVWDRFLAACDAIVMFSEDSRQLMGKVYPWLLDSPKVSIVPHEVPKLDRVVRSQRKHSGLTIGVLGEMSYIKGLGVVERLVTLLRQNKTDAEIVLIGHAEDGSPALRASETGRYMREDLPRIIEERGIDVILIPSICPETFSYTATEAMDMDMPVAAFDIGAPAERIAGYGKGVVMPLDSTPEQILLVSEELAFGELHLDELPTA